MGNPTGEELMSHDDTVGVVVLRVEIISVLADSAIGSRDSLSRARTIRSLPLLTALANLVFVNSHISSLLSLLICRARGAAPDAANTLLNNDWEGSCIFDLTRATFC